MEGSGVYTPNPTATNFSSYWTFPDAATHRARFEWYVPVGWEAFVGRIGIISPAGTGGNTLWRWSHLLVDINGNPGAAMSSIGQAVLPQPAGFGTALVYADVTDPVELLPDLPLSKGVALTMIERIGSDALDTSAAPVGLAVATMTRVDP
jgi:hypothetical protein